MRRYRIIFEVHSPLSTPLMGDTLFGHICWGIIFHEGERALSEFFQSYEDGNPILIISNGFPHDTLPKPLLKPQSKRENINLEDYKNLKRLNKIQYIPKKLFFDKSFSFSFSNLISEIENIKKSGKPQVESMTIERIHTAINRLTGTVEEGILFPTREWWFTFKENRYLTPLIDVYVLSPENPDIVKRYISWGIENGYGADKSSGKGTLKIKEIESSDFPDNGNIAMSLGHFVPGPNDSISNLRASTFTKYGRLGGLYALMKNPFKKPIIMYREGATFYTNDKKEFVGCLLKDVHTDPAIRHHALAPVIYFKTGEEN
jgi:CRISPR-associated protein Csm4